MCQVYQNDLGTSKKTKNPICTYKLRNKHETHFWTHVLANSFKTHSRTTTHNLLRALSTSFASYFIFMSLLLLQGVTDCAWNETMYHCSAGQVQEYNCNSLQYCLQGWVGEPPPPCLECSEVTKGRGGERR